MKAIPAQHWMTLCNRYKLDPSIATADELEAAIKRAGASLAVTEVMDAIATVAQNIKRMDKAQ